MNAQHELAFRKRRVRNEGKDPERDRLAADGGKKSGACEWRCNRCAHAIWKKGSKRSPDERSDIRVMFSAPRGGRGTSRVIFFFASPRHTDGRTTKTPTFEKKLADIVVNLEEKN